MRSENDPNAYRLGRIGPHYVVINRPRFGRSGQLPASQIVNGMKSTFPGMRFWLLVGIGGGAPSQKADIRLGDVVLGMSVLPYKKGKEKDNTFKITGKAKEPPVELLDVVTELKHKLDYELSLDQMLDTVLQRLLASQPDSQGALRRNYRRPSNDHLWRSDYIHGDNDCDCLHQPPNDTSRSIQRVQRDTEQLIQTHCGIIGSADQVMKNARKRDMLAREEDIICFEMEATAAMEAATGNQALTGCMSIRGISDYSDGHKNDLWHNYAAFSAAVCAAELLKCLSLKTVLKMTIKLTLEDLKIIVHSAVSGVDARINGRLNTADNQMKQLQAANVKIQESISFLDNFAENQKKFNESEMKDMRVACQQKLDESIRGLQRQAKIEAAKADYVTRAEWEKFKKQIENTAEKSSKLATVEEVFETTAELAECITEDVKGKRVGSVSSYFRFGSMFAGHARSFRGIDGGVFSIACNIRYSKLVAIRPYRFDFKR
ncbi:hypothetical protein FVEG_17240 [Fusarium verticillioides 7600]|uniref:Nucleoside phosphorylase domain-containing protein n=1 Tax=Gibberella moniliformis (strain M3125 / FGSC 7600) TaxID=334819 RepID=W7N1R3_GIBM7|nr:hypothetical protein FVEG_17240 [Fusarium verticillioides 7600]EWG54080.1 hypothetical protein FVEG_17240 [Fusarium verticillioides 7600]